jgi:hypothetical protein
MSEDLDNTEQRLDAIYKDEALVKPPSYPRMRRRMKKIVMYIENQLGGQVLELELKPEDIKLIVEQAFEELVHYMTDVYTVTIPYAECMDLRKYHIDSVESVLRGQDSILTGMPFIIPAISLNNITGMYDIDNYANSILIKRNLNTLATDMEFVWDKPNRKLYVYANPNPPSLVTVVFKPEYFSVEDIREGFWETQLRKLALGMCKVIIGRIRSKYTSSSTKFQLDGPTLLSEGNAEIQEVRQCLDNNKDIFTVLN